jgi:uncharacterized protein
MILMESASVAIAAIAGPLGSTNETSVGSSIAPTSDADGSTVRSIKNPSLPVTPVNPTPTTSAPNPANPSNSDSKSADASLSNQSDFTTLLAKAQRGDPQAELGISVDYYMGKGIPQDYQKTFQWNLESAIQGNATAAKNMGALYDGGQGVHRNPLKASEWFLKGAKLGSSEAQRVIGIRLQFGVGVARNVQEAMAWLRKAAIQGDSQAQARLGDNLMHGIGGTTDLEQGFAYLLAATKNEPFARYIVGKCYADGLYVPRDPVHAYAWCLTAPTSAQQAQALMATLKKQMNEDEIKKATSLSAKLLKEYQDGNFQADNMISKLSGSSITLKFKDVFGYIIVPLTLQNKEQVNFMIDTGFSLSVVDARIASRFGLTGTEYLPMGGVGASLELATVAENVSISGSGLNITGAHVALLPHFDLDEYLGQPLGGFIGTDILKHFIVRIDYEKKTLTLALPDSLLEDPRAVSLPMEVTGNAPMIQAMIGNPATGTAGGRFLIDTGDRGSIHLTKLFRMNHPSIEIHKMVSSSDLGLGGAEKTDIGRTALSLDNIYLKDPIISLSQDSLGTWSWLDGGDIGEDIWSRFGLTLDFPASKIFLQPNAKLNLPFNYTYGGFGIKTTGGDYKTFVVYEVVPDSPAASVGLQKGDLVVQVDKQATDQMTMDKIYDILIAEGLHELQINRNGVNITFEVPVFDPFKHPEQVAWYKSKAQPDPSYPKIGSFAVHNVGPAIYPDEVIERATGLQTGDAYTPFAASRGVKQLYSTGMFKKVVFEADRTPGSTTVNIYVTPNPVVKSITITGLLPQEDANLRPQLITEVGKRTSAYDLFQDGQLVRTLLGKGNPTERTISIDVMGEDGSREHKDVVIPKAGAGV